MDVNQLLSNLRQEWSASEATKSKGESRIKQLKSSLQDLREIFERSMTVKDIAESLVSFDEGRSAEEVRKFMEDNDYDVVGIRVGGVISKYARREDVTAGKVGAYAVPFEPSRPLPEVTPLSDVLQALRDPPHLAFVTVLGQVGGIVTKGDLQKMPVRMWLFALVSLIEMHMLRLIRETYQNNSWIDLVSEKRLKDAQKLFDERQLRNEAIDLCECLQFGDKRDVVLKNASLRETAGFNSRIRGERHLKELERVRDKLAHSGDMITGDWPRIVDLALKAEETLSKLQEAVVTHPLPM